MMTTAKLTTTRRPHRSNPQSAAPVGRGKWNFSSAAGAFARLLVCATTLLAAACAGTDKGPDLPATSTIKSAGTEGGPVVLGEGDSIKLYFAGSPEYNSVQKIRTDGKISLPLIGEVQAAGKTLPRLQSDLAASFKPLLQNSEVVISLEASGKPVIVSGGVAGPGKFVFDRPTTLLEAIMGAGGFTDFAKRKQVRLIRLVNGQYHTEVYDMSKGLKGGATPVVYVKGGDVIYIPVSNW